MLRGTLRLWEGPRGEVGVMGEMKEKSGMFEERDEGEEGVCEQE